MDSTIYLITQLMIFLLVFGLIGAILFGLRHAFYLLGVPKEKGEQMILYVRTGLVFWLLITGLLAWNDYFSNFKYFYFRVGLVLLPACFLVVYLAFFSKKFYSILLTIPEKWLIQVQAFRLLVDLVLWLGLLGAFVPFQMTFLGFNQDIIVGLTAPLAAALFFRKGRRRQLEALIWNVFGILLLANAFVVAMLSAPARLRAFFFEPVNNFSGSFPFIWIITFIIPFALAMHLFSIRKLGIFFRKKS